MDWAKAVERNSAALAGIVATLFAMLGFAGGAMAERLPRPVHVAALRILRPAESAVRRLIVVAARDVKVKPVTSRPPPHARIIGPASASGSGLVSASRPSFQLFDPRKSFAARSVRRKVAHVPPRVVPRISVLGHDPTVAAMWAWRKPVAQPALALAPAPAPEDDGLVNAVPLCRRLMALEAALADIPRQARRMARWRAKRQELRVLRPVFVSPLRPGPPPGLRRKPARDIDRVLRECHDLALGAMGLDTS